MALGLYKPGQGYWVRVMTATMAGILILAACAWLWGQIEGPAGRLIPINQYQLNLSPAEGQTPPGGKVALHSVGTQQGQPGPRIGTADVISSDSTSAGGDRLVIKPPVFDDPAMDISSAKFIRPVETGGTLSGEINGGAVSKRAFEPIYIQAGAVGLVMLIGSILAYRFAGTKEGSVEFLIATDGEMKKVNWSTRKNVIDSTIVVILWAFLIAGGLFLVDLAFSNFFKLIGILQA